MTDAELDAIRKRCAAATAGPWERVAGDVFSVAADGGPVVVSDAGLRDDDGDFLAHARIDLPLAITEIDRLRAELANLRQTDAKVFGVNLRLAADNAALAAAVREAIHELSDDNGRPLSRVERLALVAGLRRVLDGVGRMQATEPEQES